MKAYVVSKPCSLENIREVEMPIPEIGRGQVLVRWHASSLNYHDYIVVSGMKPISAENIIPLSDGAGEIVAVGEGVTRWQVGNKVMSLFFPDWHESRATPEKVAVIPGDTATGYACEMSAVDQNSLTFMPQHLSYAEAATLPCAGLTAWRSLFVDCQLSVGDKVLIEGSGGFSLFALQFAKAAGAIVYATSSSDEKLEKMKALGADVLVNYRHHANWGEVVYELSNGGVDHVLDVGGSTLTQSIQACRIGATAISVGILDGFTTELNLGLMINKQIVIKSVMVGSREMQESMVNFINYSGMKPVVDKHFPLAELANAFRYQKEGKHFGKIAITY